MYEGMIFFMGAVLGLCATMLATSYQKELDNCAKTHNVYQCELVAVPVTGENK